MHPLRGPSRCPRPSHAGWVQQQRQRRRLRRAGAGRRARMRARVMTLRRATTNKRAKTTTRTTWSARTGRGREGGRGMGSFRSAVNLTLPSLMSFIRATQRCDLTGGRAFLCVAYLPSDHSPPTERILTVHRTPPFALIFLLPVRARMRAAAAEFRAPREVGRATLVAALPDAAARATAAIPAARNDRAPVCPARPALRGMCARSDPRHRHAPPRQGHPGSAGPDTLLLILLPFAPPSPLPPRPMILPSLAMPWPRWLVQTTAVLPQAYTGATTQEPLNPQEGAPA